MVNIEEIGNKHGFLDYLYGRSYFPEAVLVVNMCPGWDLFGWWRTVKDEICTPLHLYIWFMGMIKLYLGDMDQVHVGDIRAF